MVTDWLIFGSGVESTRNLRIKTSLPNVDSTILMLATNFPRLVMRKIEPLFKVDTFEEIVKNTKEVHQSLKNLGCFQSVNIEVDTLPDPAQEIYQVQEFMT